MICCRGYDSGWQRLLCAGVELISLGRKPSRVPNANSRNNDALKAAQESNKQDVILVCLSRRRDKEANEVVRVTERRI